MAPRTQLDALIKLLESREEWLGHAHAHALHGLVASREAEARLGARLAAEKPSGATADEWRACEQRCERLRIDLRAQQQQTRRCLEEVELTRAALATAHRRAESMRRAADRIRTGLVRARERSEEREQDELALLQFRQAS